MNLSPPTLLRAVRDTLVDPKAAAHSVMGLRLSVAQGLMALALTAVLATLLTALMQAFMGCHKPHLAGAEYTGSTRRNRL